MNVEGRRPHISFSSLPNLSPTMRKTVAITCVLVAYIALSVSGFGDLAQPPPPPPAPTFGFGIPNVPSAVFRPTCETKECPPIDECCEDQILGPVCYSYHTHRCVNDNTLCGVQDGVCAGNVCYDMGVYDCVDGVLVFKTCDHALSCGTGDLCCVDRTLGPICFDMFTHACLPVKNNDMTEFVLCGASDSICGFDCYDPSRYACEEGILIQTYVGEGYQPEPVVEEQCSLDLCPESDGCCMEQSLGTTCYNPRTHVCIPHTNGAGSTLCKLGDRVCGPQRCYNPSQYECVNNILLPRILKFQPGYQFP